MMSLDAICDAVGMETASNCHFAQNWRSVLVPLATCVTGSPVSSALEYQPRNVLLVLLGVGSVNVSVPSVNVLASMTSPPLTLYVTVYVGSLSSSPPRRKMPPMAPPPTRRTAIPIAIMYFISISLPPTFQGTKAPQEKEQDIATFTMVTP